MTGVSEEEIVGKGDYAYAVPFYGEPRPIMIDLVLKEDGSTALKYAYMEKVDSTIYAEAYVPCAYQGRGAWLWGTASPLVDNEGNQKRQFISHPCKHQVQPVSAHDLGMLVAGGAARIGGR